MAVGCLLLLMPVRGTSEEQGQKTDEQECFDLENFERRLEQVIAEIEGVGEARVILSLHGGSRQILAQDRQQDSAGASAQTVTVGSASDRQVVPVQTMAPEFRGALVVCQGAEDAGVRLEVTKAVCVLTGLGTDCVCVTTGTS
jgi:stage III sporulation protein AG